LLRWTPAVILRCCRVNVGIARRLWAKRTSTCASKMTIRRRSSFAPHPVSRGIGAIFDDLAFRIDGRKVELLGAVIRSALKSDAERPVRRLEVLPLSPEDGRIRSPCMARSMPTAQRAFTRCTAFRRSSRFGLNASSLLG
jgi:hypothetical protein